MTSLLIDSPKKTTLGFIWFGTGKFRGFFVNIPVSGRSPESRGGLTHDLLALCTTGYNKAVVGLALKVDLARKKKGDRGFVNAPTLLASRNGKLDAHVSVRIRSRHRSRSLGLFRKGLPGRVQLAQPLLVRLARNGVPVLAVDEVERAVQV